MDATSYGGSWAIWENPADDDANRQWHDEIVAIMKPFTNQHYIGETDIVQDPIASAAILLHRKVEAPRSHSHQIRPTRSFLRLFRRRVSDEIRRRDVGAATIATERPHSAVPTRRSWLISHSGSSLIRRQPPHVPVSRSAQHSPCVEYNLFSVRPLRPRINYVEESTDHRIERAHHRPAIAEERVSSCRKWHILSLKFEPNKISNRFRQPRLEKLRFLTRSI